ncbi:hypothetical protein Tco_0588527, partial [Tanacetum coccineum]
MILRVLHIILEVLLEHPSNTKVLTMKMEILLEPTSNKLLVGKYGDFDGYTSDDPILKLESCQGDSLLKINLPDHRSVLTDPKDQVMMEMEIPYSSGVN